MDNFRKYIKLLVRYHSDPPDITAVSDEMGDLWRTLNKEDQNFCNGLAINLDILINSENSDFRDESEVLW